MLTKYQHTPVMLKEVLEYLDPQAGQYFIDCTLGGAGYTIAIARKIGRKGKVLSIDLDKLAIKNAKNLIKKNKYKNIILAHDNFKNLSKIVKQYFKDKQMSCGSDEIIRRCVPTFSPKVLDHAPKNDIFNGIVFDLGLSSAQLQDRSRGFSFQLDAPLNMCFAQTGQQTTEYIVNKYKQKELEKVIREYGEERFAKKIASAIVSIRKNNPIKTTGQLVEVIKSAVPKKYLYSRIHPATRTFQALRIATNNELENLKQALSQALDLLVHGGKIVVVSYHSLEDRIVKQFFKQESKDCICPPSYPACRCQHQARIKILTPKVVRAGEEEVRDNPRARGAKLRAAEKL